MKLLLLTFVLLGCTPDDCPEGINKLPLYGRQKKCKEQIQSDNEFLKEADKNFENRQVAAKYYIDRAWNYFYENKLDTSIMRFNQAWLLDSLNSDIFWGFGNILGRQKKYKESTEFFEISIKMNPNNETVYECAATSYGNLFYQTKDKKALDKSIECLKKALFLDSKNARVLGQLAASYSYFVKKDSALKYLKLTDEIDPKMINPDVRKMLTNK
jgi:tetratricopeptide (TPR) repeat protein